VHSRRRALAGCKETSELAAPVEVGDDASDGVVSRGCDRNRSLGRVVAFLGEAPHQGREPGAIDRAQIEKSRSASGNIAGNDIPRGELVGEPLAVLVQQEGALSAKRLREQQ